MTQPYETEKKRIRKHRVAGPSSTSKMAFAVLIMVLVAVAVLFLISA